jgi:hypothetical protein
VIHHRRSSDAGRWSGGAVWPRPISDELALLLEDSHLLEAAPLRRPKQAGQPLQQRHLLRLVF